MVDLKRFRRIAAGDRLRGQYQALSQDPNSLSNLDQVCISISSLCFIKAIKDSLVFSHFLSWYFIAFQLHLPVSYPFPGSSK